MNKSLKKNITYNIVSQTVALLVPLIVTPYIARVFNAELLGAYGYAYANSSYFILLECLGFPLYGQIRISVDRDDINQRSAIFWEITLLKIVFMILCLALYFFIVILNTDGMVFRLSVIMTLNIVSNGIDTTWILNGLEDFKAVAIRNVLIRGYLYLCSYYANCYFSGFYNAYSQNTHLCEKSSGKKYKNQKTHKTSRCLFYSQFGYYYIFFYR